MDPEMLARRVAVVIVAVAVLVACAAEPAAPVVDPTVDAVEDGRALVEEVLSRYRAASSYSHTCSWSTVITKADEGEPWHSEQGGPALFSFERPDRFVAESPDRAIYCDGVTLWTWDRQRDEYVATPLAEVQPPPFGLTGAVEVGFPAAASAHMLLVGVEDPDGEPVEPLLADGGTYSVEEEVRDGLDGRWVRVTSPSPGFPTSVSVWIDDDTGLVLAWEITSSAEMADAGGAWETYQTRLSISCRDVELDPDIPDAAFRFTPDTGAREVPPTRVPTAG